MADCSGAAPGQTRPATAKRRAPPRRRAPRDATKDLAPCLANQTRQTPSAVSGASDRRAPTQRQSAAKATGSCGLANRRIPPQRAPATKLRRTAANQATGLDARFASRNWRGRRGWLNEKPALALAAPLSMQAAVRIPTRFALAGRNRPRLHGLKLIEHFPAQSPTTAPRRLFAPRVLTKCNVDAASGDSSFPHVDCLRTTANCLLPPDAWPKFQLSDPLIPAPR
jgi:hypothetical protein